MNTACVLLSFTLLSAQWCISKCEFWSVVLEVQIQHWTFLSFLSWMWSLGNRREEKKTGLMLGIQVSWVARGKPGVHGCTPVSANSALVCIQTKMFVFGTCGDCLSNPKAAHEGVKPLHLWPNSAQHAVITQTCGVVLMAEKRPCSSTMSTNTVGILCVSGQWQTTEACILCCCFGPLILPSVINFSLQGNRSGVLAPVWISVEYAFLIYLVLGTGFLAESRPTYFLQQQDDGTGLQSRQV